MSDVLELVIERCYSSIAGASAAALLGISSAHRRAILRMHDLLLKNAAICVPCKVIYYGGLSGGLRSCLRGCTLSWYYAYSELETDSVSFELCIRWCDWLCQECGGSMRTCITTVGGIRRLCNACCVRFVSSSAEHAGSDDDSSSL